MAFDVFNQPTGIEKMNAAYMLKKVAKCYPGCGESVIVLLEMPKVCHLLGKPSLA